MTKRDGLTPARLTLTACLLLLTPSAATGQLTITLTALNPSGTVGLQYWDTTIAEGGTAPYTFAVTSGSLPPGVSLQPSPANDRIDVRGTPTAAGTYPFTITATDAGERTAAWAFTITVAGQALTISPDALPDVKATVPYSVTLTASGGTPPYHFRLSDGRLPSEFTLSESGVLSGTTSFVFYYQITVEATDSTGAKGTHSYLLNVKGGGLIVDTTLADGQLRTPYRAELRLRQTGTPPYSWRILSGKLPNGLTLSSSGVISGSPEESGWFGFEVGVQDSAGRTGNANLSFRIEGPVLSISPLTIPDATAGVPYRLQFVAVGGIAPYRFQMTSSNSWEVHMEITPEGLMQGTPVFAREGIVFTLQVTDGNASVATRTYTFSVHGTGTLALTPSELPPGAVGKPYSALFESSGGQPPYTYSTTSGAFPRGVSLASNGSVAGSPERSGHYPVTVQVRDASGATLSRAYTIDVSTPQISIQPDTLPDAILHTPYSASVTAQGGQSPYRYRILTGNPPDGLSFNAGRFGGTPTRAGSFRFAVEAEDSAGLKGIREYVVEARDAVLIDPDSLPTGLVDEPYRVVFRVAASGSWTLDLTGDLPPGLTYAPSSRTLDGTPTEAGLYTFTLTARDASGLQPDFSKVYTLEVVKVRTIRVIPTELPRATAGQFYRTQLNATGGTPPYTLIAKGSLPPNLQLVVGGVLQGTPSRGGIFRFRVAASDSKGATGESELMLDVASAGDLRIEPAVLLPATTAAGYKTQLECAGGKAPCTWKVVFGSLPAGLLLSLSGAITGNAQSPGLYHFSIEARDQDGTAAVRDYELRVSGLEVSPRRLLPALVGVAYDAALSVKGGTEPYQFKLAEGSLPSGITLSATGAFSGTATAAGEFPIVVEASDSAGETAQIGYVLSVVPKDLRLSTTQLPRGGAGIEYHATLEATGGKPPYRFRLENQGPRGLVLREDGLLFGTPLEAGKFDLDLTVADADDASARRTLQLEVEGQPLALDTNWLAVAQAGVSYEVRLSASGGTPPYHFAVRNGTLPPGLELSEDRLTGTPGEAGAYLFDLTVIDSNEHESARTLPMTVAAATLEARAFAEPVELNFRLREGATDAAVRCVALLAPGGTAAATASLYTPGGAWATLDRTNVQSPGSVCVSVSIAGSTPGVQRGELRLLVTGAQPPILTLPLELVVEPAAPAILHALPESVRILLPAGQASARSAVLLSNDGSGSAAATVDKPTATWLSASPSSLEMDARSIAPISLEAAGEGLSSGVYATELHVDGGAAGSLSIPVEVLAGAAPLSFRVMPEALAFIAWQGGAEPPTQQIAITNSGAEPVEVAISSLSDSPWIELIPGGSGPIAPGETRAIGVAVHPASLPPGSYTARLAAVASPAVLGSTLLVRLTVLEPERATPSMDALPAVELSPGTLTRKLRVDGPPGEGHPIDAVVIDGSGRHWLAVEPLRAETAVDGSAEFNVTADPAGLDPGLYHAALVAGFDNGTARTIPIHLVVPRTPPEAKSAEADSGCAAASLLARVLEPADGFRAVAGSAVAIRVAVTRCDGAPPAGVEVRAGDGSHAVVLPASKANEFTGSIQFARPAENAWLEVRALQPETGETTTVRLTGRINGADASTPVVSAVHTGAGTPGPAVPGSWIMIGGQRLAPRYAAASFDTALPDTLEGVRVWLGGAPLPLLGVSPDRIDAFVPASTPAGGIANLTVETPAGPSTPYELLVSPAYPQIHTRGGEDTTVLAVDVTTATVVTADQPVHPGDVVVIAVYGLPVADPVAVLVGDLSVTPEGVNEAGGAFGGQQVRFKVPAGVSAKTAVPLKLRQGTRVSNTVTLPVR